MEPAVGAQPPGGTGPAQGAAPPARAVAAAPHVGLQVLGAVVGSVTGTVVTNVAGSSQMASLLAAALGAALPALIALVGPFKFRLGLGLAVLAAGLAITYFGYTLWQNGWAHTTFPSPLAKPKPSGGGGGGGASGGGAGGGQTGPGIAVDPASLHCTAAACERSVVISSTGTRPLEVTSIEFADAPSGLFTGGDECVGSLDPGETCEFAVGFHPAGDEGDQTGTLVIHQNLAGGPTTVALTGSGGPDIAFTGDPVTCTEDGVAATIAFAVDGPAGTVQAVTSLSDQVVDVPTGQPTGIKAPQPPTPGTEVTVTLDPQDQLHDPDTGNNVTTVQCPSS